MSTFVYYFIPDDNEKEEGYMNIFIIYKDYKDVKVSDIKENFPLPGEYNFRFKFNYEGKTVWIDFNNPKGQLPQFEGKIIVKVQRLKWENQKHQNSNNINNIFTEFK
jgi:hypothetical protein